jgi:hypothetical protein
VNGYGAKKNQQQSFNHAEAAEYLEQDIDVRLACATQIAVLWGIID